MSEYESRLIKMREELTLKKNNYHELIGLSDDLQCNYKQKRTVTLELLLMHHDAIGKIKKESIVALKEILICENKITVLEIALKEKKKSKQVRCKN